MNKNIAILYTTVSTAQEAEQLATLAIAHKMAACVNIIPGGKSVYFWEGKIEHHNECYMIFKTTIGLINELECWIVKHHPYDVPAILKFNAESSEDFTNYLSRSMLTKNS